MSPRSRCPSFSGQMPSAILDSTMETLDSEPSSPSTAILDSEPSSPSTAIHSKPQISSPLPSSILRLWRQAAQRNLRNQWSQLALLKDQWSHISSTAKSYASALVNAHLSQRYMPDMKLGVLTNMSHIRNRASFKLFNQQKLQRSQLLKSYKDMVGVVSKMVNVSRSMKCFFRRSSNSSLLQFSHYSIDQSDSGDGGGIPVFAFFSISSHEKLVEELVQMFRLELCLKRLLVLEFMFIGDDASQVNQLHWSSQIYVDEFKDLNDCNLFCELTRGPVQPRLREGKSDMGTLRFDSQPNPEVLQVYLTTWLAGVNINTSRVNEIFEVVGEEMHVNIG